MSEDKRKYKSMFRILIYLLNASVLGSFVASLISVIFFGPAALFFVLFAPIAGPLYAFPALIFVAFPYCIVMDRRRQTEKQFFTIGGAVIAGLYSVLLIFLGDTFDAAIWATVFAIGGWFTGLIYWKEMYSGVKGWRLI